MASRIPPYAPGRKRNALLHRVREGMLTILADENKFDALRPSLNRPGEASKPVVNRPI
jgi:hypothetical protein